MGIKWKECIKQIPYKNWNLSHSTWWRLYTNFFFSNAQNFVTDGSMILIFTGRRYGDDDILGNLITFYECQNRTTVRYFVVLGPISQGIGLKRYLLFRYSFVVDFFQ